MTRSTNQPTAAATMYSLTSVQNRGDNRFVSPSP